MKDVPHHMMKFMKKHEKDNNNSQEVEDEETKMLNKEKHVPPSKKEQRKQVKENMKKQTDAQIPEKPTPDEQNKKMRKRVPEIRKRSHKAQ